MLPRPDSLAREFRAAILAGDHGTAERLAAEYGQALRLLWDSMSEQERAASAIPGQARELLSWAREMTIIQRALAAEHLAMVQKASRYRPADASSATRATIAVQA